MRKRKILIFLISILALAVFAWTSGDALSQTKGANYPTKEEIGKDTAVKGKVTRDDVANYLGKVTPSEQKAAAKRAVQLGLYPGVAGSATQTSKPVLRQ